MKIRKQATLNPPEMQKVKQVAVLLKIVCA